MAGREIKTTLGVDGEQAFKRSIKEAQTSVRNLGTQLTLAQAEFKRDGDAMKLMETRAKALRSEIAQQKEIVKALEGAVKDAAKEYGEGSKEAEKWEAELNRAKAAMANLEQELNNNNNGLDRTGKAFQNAEEKAGSFSTAVSNIDRNTTFNTITSGIGRITGAFETAISKVGELSRKMWDLMREAAQWADDVHTNAMVLGVSDEEYQRMQHASEFVNVSVETMARSQQIFKSAMKGGLGNKQLVDDMKDLRIPMQDATGAARDWRDMYWEAGAALMAMDDEVKQNEIAMRLFGKSWTELRPMFTVPEGESARGRYNQLMEAAPVVSQESIDRLNSLQDQLKEMDAQFQVLKISVLSDLAPAFEVLAKCLTELMTEFNEFLQTDDGKAMMKDLRDSLTSFFSGIKDIDFNNAVNTVKEAFENIRKALEWVVVNKESIWNAIKYILGAFGLLKVGSLGVSAVSMASGIKYLFKGGGSGAGAAATQAGSGAETILETTKGGMVSGFTNSINQKALNLAANSNQFSITNNGAIWDWFMHTPLGMSLQNEVSRLFGGGDIYGVGGISDWWQGKKDEVAHNAETFEEDWENNVIYKGLKELFGRRDENSDAATRLETGADWRLSTQRGFASVMEQPNNPLNWAPSYMGGVSPTLYQQPVGAGGSSERQGVTSEDLRSFRNTPEGMYKAVRNGMSGIRVDMDGQTVGRLVAKYVSTEIAREVQ